MITSERRASICEQDGSLLLLTYDEVRQMYFQNPAFGFYFLELVAERLSRDATRRRAEAVPRSNEGLH